MGALGRWIAGVALVASLGLNGFLLRGARRDAEALAREVKARRAQAAQVPADDDTCHSDLERCRAEGWKLLARSINAPAAAARVDAGAATTAAATTQATPPRQKAMLCDISQAYLRAFWESQKDPITRTVLADFADPRKQAVEARKTADRMASTLGLTPAQADGLATDYDRIHAGHISRAVAGLSRDPPDYETALGEVKGLYADEDALIGRLRGGDAVEQWRTQEMVGRTSILALTATFAGDPWDDAITW